MSQYVIKGVNGPVVTVVGGQGLAMMDMVHVGNEGLIGEVVGVSGGVTTVQVYEDTAGLAPGQPVTATGAPMSVKLGPGLLSNIFDGIARPLNVIQDKAGPFITRGINISARSMGLINVQLIMEKMGGGGHQTMAATQLRGVEMEKAKALLFETIDDYYSTH